MGGRWWTWWASLQKRSGTAYNKCTRNKRCRASVHGRSRTSSCCIPLNGKCFSFLRVVSIYLALASAIGVSTDLPLGNYLHVSNAPRCGPCEDLRYDGSRLANHIGVH